MKAVLVMDMPVGCHECGFCVDAGDRCFMLDEDIPEKIYLKGERLKGCPLSQIPGKHNTDAKQVGEQWAVFNNGWNACIDAITGES